MSRAKGNIAEDSACDYLTAHGYQIIERNFYAKTGEIDIIVSRDEVLHFVEVKSGNSFEPVYNITPGKLRKIIKTAQFYMKKNGIDPVFSIDAIIVSNGEIEFLENVTL